MTKMICLIVAASLGSPTWAETAAASSNGQAAVSQQQPAASPQRWRAEDVPGFQQMSPAEQEQLRKILEATAKAMEGAGAKQPGAANNSATPAPPPQAAAPALPPCKAPKPPSFLDKLKYHAERTLAQQAQGADVQIAKGTGGKVDGGLTDAAISAINQANQPQPCTPVKGQAGKP